MTALTLQQISAANRARCERWHPGFPNDGWTGADWSNAMAGEAGETCNVVKKLRRLDFDLQQAAADTRPDLLAKLATEVGDTFIYLDLLAQHYGLDLGRCVVDTFNRVSVREGFPERLLADVDSIAAARTDVPDLLAEIRVLRDLIADLADPDPCEFDHHGYCQAHSWFTTDSPCPDGRAARLLADTEATA
jgi:NTP pyrophosphatase (non-canonical NTP hydrolase)